MKSWSTTKTYIMIGVFIVFIIMTVKPLFDTDYMIVDFGESHYSKIMSTPTSEGVALDYSLKRVYHKNNGEPYELTIYCNLPNYTRFNVNVQSNDNYGDSYKFEDCYIVDGKKTIPLGYKFLSDTTQLNLIIKYAFIAMPPKVIDGRLANNQPDETKKLLGENGEKIKIADISAKKLSLQTVTEKDNNIQHYYFSLEEKINMPKKK